MSLKTLIWSIKEGEKKQKIIQHLHGLDTKGGGSNKVLLCGCYLVTVLDETHVFDWYIVRCRSKNKTPEKHMCQYILDHIFKLYQILHTP